MKFLKEPNEKGVQIPAAVLTLSQLTGGSLELRTLSNAAVLLSDEMTAMELIRASESLRELSCDLLAHLAMVCAPWDNCCNPEETSAEADMTEVTKISLPAWALQEAGIEQGAKLACAVDENGEIHVREADYAYDLTDVPPHVLRIFQESGLGLDALEEHLMDEDIVYGE